MPSITLSNGSAGPTVTIALAPSVPLQQALIAAGRALPPPVSGVFLVDTGASHTVVCHDLIKSLNLNPTGSVLCHTPSTSGVAVSMYQYDLMIFVPNPATSSGWMIDAMPVMASSFEGQAIDGLIGRDIIDRCVLIYNGQANHFTLAY